MEEHSKIGIYFTILTVIFLLVGMFIIPRTNEAVTAAAVANFEKVKIGSVSEEERLREEILLKKDIGEGTTTTITSAATSISSTSTIIQVESSTSSTTSTTSSTTSTMVSGQGPATFTLLPTAAVDINGLSQVLPDDGKFDGTVELSNNDVRWLTEDDEYVEVTSWDTLIPEGSTISSVIATCELDWSNKQGGNIEFSYKTGSSWSNQFCSQFVEEGPGEEYSCDLRDHGLDTVEEINNVDLRCRMSSSESGGNIGFSLDHIYITVTIT